MSFMTPVIGMIHNVKEHKFHPVLFTEHPFPGPPSDEKPRRFKSKMHHTTGFNTRDEAMANVQELASQVVESGVFIGEPLYLKDLADASKDIEWNGEGIPAMCPILADSDFCTTMPQAL